MHGLTGIAECGLPDRPGRARHLRHEATGAELLLIETDAPAHAFGIAFRTQPRDDTGVAHILEHAVLCGSQRFSRGKPFADLLRSSMQCFLNAMTLPDMTFYGAASPHPADFAHLVEVYLDAVFSPLLTEQTFAQEAWRPARDAAGRPAIQGVVYNEMKGYLAQPLNRLEDGLRRALYPGTVWGLAYGGDPAAIPNLTPDDLRAFHRQFYVPANALILCAGPPLTDRVAALIGDRLGRSAAGTRTPPAAGAQGFTAPQGEDRPYPGQGMSGRDGYLGLGWVLPAAALPEAELDRRLLDRLLLGPPDAVLRRALVETGMARDLVQSGHDHNPRQPAFRIGLSGTDPGSAEPIEAAALDALERTARDGFAAADLAAAVNSVAFGLREGPAGPLPDGVWQMLAACRHWRHGGDPLAALRLQAAVPGWAAQAGTDQDRLRGAIAAMLGNPHRVRLALAPDPGMAAELAAAEAALAARVAASPRPSAPLPATGGSPVPMLSLSDLAPAPPQAEVTAEAASAITQHVPGRGLVWLDLGLDLSGLPPEQLPLARFLGLLLGELATTRHNATGLNRRIGTETGGIGALTRCGTHVSGRPELRLWLRGKALAGQTGALARLMAELLHETRFDDPPRLALLRARERARAEAALLHAGHEVADRRIRAALSPEGAADETLAGRPWLAFLHSAEAETLPPQLDALRARLLAQGGMVSAAGDAEALAAARPHLALLALAPTAPAPACALAAMSLPRAEALELPGTVAHVGMGGDLRAAGLALSGATQAAVRHLAAGWLWPRVREAGGAYGALARFEPVRGDLRMLSFRDPRLLGTLADYDAAAEFLDRPPSARDLTAAVIAAVAAEDRPMPPAEAALAGAERWLAGQDADWRRARRAELLGASRGDFRAMAAALQAMAAQVAVVAGPQMLDQAEAARPGWLRRTRLL